MVPWLWLCGPSGVGKSSVSVEIFRQLRADGVSTGYVDTDQLGMCCPTPAGDPDNHAVKSGCLGAVWPTYRDAGVRCFIVSGGVDSADEVRRYADLLPGTALTLCRLRVGPQELRRRLAHRGWGGREWADRAVRTADALDRTDFARPCVYSEALTVEETARLVRERAGGWPGDCPGWWRRQTLTTYRPSDAVSGR